MPDLHGWIDQQITATEARARACPPWPTPDETTDDYVDIDVRDARGQVHLRGLLVTPAAVLRRCAADRNILAIHARVHGGIACFGCGTWGDCQDWETGNVNDCPILLAIAIAYGITDDVLASLDRPQPPPRPAVRPHGPRPDTSRVPAALRGPNWKART